MRNNVLLIVLLLIVAALTGIMVHFRQEAQRISKTLEAERYNRLVAEERVVNTVSKIRQLENDLKSSEEKIAKVQNVLKDQKNINNELEKQYDRLTKAKADLEEQLRVAMTPPAPVVQAEASVGKTNQDIEVAQASN